MGQKLGWSAAMNTKDRGHFSFGAVSTNTPRILVIETNDIDILSVQVTSTGTLAATITVLASNSYIPGAADPQFGAFAAPQAPQRAGTFVSITSRVTGITNPSGAGGDCIITIGAEAEPTVPHCFVMISFVQSAGSGNLDMFVSGKTLGR